MIFIMIFQVEFSFDARKSDDLLFKWCSNWPQLGHVTIGVQTGHVTRPNPGKRGQVALTDFDILGD